MSRVRRRWMSIGVCGALMAALLVFGGASVAADSAKPATGTVTVIKPTEKHLRDDLDSATTVMQQETNPPGNMPTDQSLDDNPAPDVTG